MKRILGISLVFAASFSVSAMAVGDPAAERQAVMKNVGAATGVASKMVKGEVEFDAVAAELAMRTLNNAGLAFGFMFPEGSETGAKTEASPKIWEDRAGFDKAVNKFIADTNVSGPIADLDALKAAFGKATENCGSCHKAWRVKK